MPNLSVAEFWRPPGTTTRAWIRQSRYPREAPGIRMPYSRLLVTLCLLGCLLGPGAIFAQDPSQESGTAPREVTSIIRPAPATASPAQPPLPPLTASGRLLWAVSTSANPSRLAGTALSSAWSTSRNQPPELGPHWDGFGKRFAARAATGTVGTFLEAGLGSVWGEDPRYRPKGSSGSIGSRLGQAAKYTFLAQNRHGNLRPAYARLLSVPAANFISTSWRPSSESSAGDTLIRVPYGFLNRFLGNLFSEFAPDLKRKLRGK